MGQKIARSSNNSLISEQDPIDESLSSLKNVKILKKIEDAYGVTGQVQIKANRTFAIKKIKFDRPNTDVERERKLVYKEFKLMNKNLSNVVRSYDFLYEKNPMCISYTMDLMEKNLYDYIRGPENIL